MVIRAEHTLSRVKGRSSVTSPISERTGRPTSSSKMRNGETRRSNEPYPDGLGLEIALSNPVLHIAFSSSRNLLTQGGQNGYEIGVPRVGSWTQATGLDRLVKAFKQVVRLRMFPD